MKFSIWLEEIDREESRSIVIDALDAGHLDDEEKGNVLGSTLEQQPQLKDKLFSYSELRPFQVQIKQFFATHQTANLTELINFLSTLGQHENPNKLPEDLEKNTPPADPDALEPDQISDQGVSGNSSF